MGVAVEIEMERRRRKRNLADDGWGIEPMAELENGDDIEDLHWGEYYDDEYVESCGQVQRNLC